MVRFDGHIVLVGPIGVGKTPVAELIAGALSIEHVMLDTADEERALVGWEQGAEILAMEAGGVEQLRYLGQFTVPLIRRLTARHRAAVLDCGGADLVDATASGRRSTRVALKRLGLNHIAAILPFETVEQSESYLADQGCLGKWNRYLIRNPSYEEVANRIFYTHGGPLESVADQVLAWVRGEGKGGRMSNH